MKLVRIAVGLVLVLALVAAGCAGLLLYNQQRLVAAVLREVSRRTGVEIASETSRLEFRSHLIVILERPRVVAQAREVATMARLRAAVSYHSILFTHGLPLYALTLEHPALRLPFDAPKNAAPGILRVQPRIVRSVLGLLAGLAGVGKRFKLVGLSVSDGSGTLLARNAGLVVFHQRLSPRLWWIGFDVMAAYPPLKGLHLTGSFRAGAGAKLPQHLVALGRLLYWGPPFDGLSLGSFSVSGKSHGRLDIRLRDDAGIEGGAEVEFKHLEVRNPALGLPLTLDGTTFESQFGVSTGRITFTQAVVRRLGAPILSGRGQVDGPAAPNPQVKLEITGLELSLKGAAGQIRALRRPPPWLTALADHVKGGVLRIESAALESPLDGLLGLERETLLKRLQVAALVSGVDAAPPAGMELPAIRNLRFQLHYAGGVFSANQGSGRIGDSTVRSLSAQLDVTNAPAPPHYRLAFNLEANLSDLKPAVLRGLAAAGVPERGRLEVLRGAADAAFDAAGDLGGGTAGRPKWYSVRIEPRGVEVGFKGAPGPITLESGTVAVEPGRVRLEKLSTRATDGTADFTGEVRFGDGGVEAPGVTIEMHQMPVERWLALAADPADVAANGRIGGALVIRKGRRDGFLVNGKLTLGRGAVQFGFLRSPMVVQVATVTMRGHRLVLSMPDARLEQAPINFELKVADLRKPVVRIDAVAQRLDLEAMRFVRMPWMPFLAQYVFKTPVTGHVTARQAKFGTLRMSNAEAEFNYDAGDWRVYNLTARALGGRLTLELDGRRRDDWIALKGRIAGADAAALFRLSPKLTRSPLKGRLDLDAELRADTDGNFFSTMTGTASVKVRDGNLDRFTLVSRLLALIDLKSWLTAQVPDPRVAGIPFRSLTAAFKGGDGVFHTDDLVLDGPVMDIVARGDVNLARATIAMKIGMLPFNTVTWLISNIPLVGQHVAGGTKNLLAAYFNVSGPIADPSVTPAPITSVEELVKKTLGLPLNIIRPDTVK